MESAQQVGRPRVEFAPAAWSQIGTLPAEVFRRIQIAVTWVASEPPRGDGSELAVTVGPWIVECSLDRERGVVLVTAVRRSGELAS